ncbi:unnamed protein product [Spirodela intermedia]|uniref:Large ribosomal subunit protein bL21m n=1 Tax=Spirodela intermedia TaxID=51605 RepID=A0A7I8IU28_SPIIN|nr:unnamed protein product [Spirodela intermedia]CAA6661129.1 unnamed protein product [Spirodela intermedia]
MGSHEFNGRPPSTSSLSGSLPSTLPPKPSPSPELATSVEGEEEENGSTQQAIGSHQFKVCNGDSIFTERLKFCEVNDKLILNKVLMLGSKAQTIIGRPILPEAAVHAVVEEHALDAKVIIFKKKRRKNYRRTKGHRQELTKLRITDIQGIDKPTRSPIPA